MRLIFQSVESCIEAFALSSLLCSVQDLSSSIAFHTSLPRDIVPRKVGFMEPKYCCSFR